MSGEFSGTKFILQIDSGSGFNSILGQVEFTSSYGGDLIDISNKSGGDYVTLLDGDLASKKYILSGSIVYNNDANYELLRELRISASIKDYRLINLDDVDDKIHFSALVSLLSDSIPHGDKVISSIEFSSTKEFGEISIEAPVLVIPDATTVISSVIGNEYTVSGGAGLANIAITGAENFGPNEGDVAQFYVRLPSLSDTQSTFGANLRWGFGNETLTPTLSQLQFEANNIMFVRAYTPSAAPGSTFSIAIGSVSGTEGGTVLNTTLHDQLLIARYTRNADTGYTIDVFINTTDTPLLSYTLAGDLSLGQLTAGNTMFACMQGNLAAPITYYINNPN